MRAGLTSLVAVAFVIAGCVDPAPTSQSPTSSIAPAAEPTVDAETGSIHGVIVDEEEVPLSMVDVSVVDVATTKTDDTGRFTVNGVPPGERGVLVAKIGYDQQVKRVVVGAGEVAEVKFVLKPIVIADVYHETFRKTGVVSGQYTVNYLQNTINNSVVDGIMCGPCHWVIAFKPDVVDAVTDMLWERTAPVPSVNEVIIMIYNKNLNQGDILNTMMSHQFKPRESYHWSETQVKSLKGVPKARLQLHGPDPTNPGIAFQQKVDLWQTWGFGEKLPDNFTMLPPPS